MQPTQMAFATEKEIGSFLTLIRKMQHGVAPYQGEAYQRAVGCLDPKKKLTLKVMHNIIQTNHITTTSQETKVLYTTLTTKLCEALESENKFLYNQKMFDRYCQIITPEYDTDITEHLALGTEDSQKIEGQLNKMRSLVNQKISLLQSNSTTAIDMADTHNSTGRLKALLKIINDNPTGPSQDKIDALFDVLCGYNYYKIYLLNTMAEQALTQAAYSDPRQEHFWQNQCEKATFCRPPQYDNHFSHFLLGLNLDQQTYNSLFPRNYNRYLPELVQCWEDYSATKGSQMQKGPEEIPHYLSELMTLEGRLHAAGILLKRIIAKEQVPLPSSNSLNPTTALRRPLSTLSSTTNTPSPRLPTSSFFSTMEVTCTSNKSKKYTIKNGQIGRLNTTSGVLFKPIAIQSIQTPPSPEDNTEHARKKPRIGAFLQRVMLGPEEDLTAYHTIRDQDSDSEHSSTYSPI